MDSQINRWTFLKLALPFFRIIILNRNFLCLKSCTPGEHLEARKIAVNMSCQLLTVYALNRGYLCVCTHALMFIRLISVLLLNVKITHAILRYINKEIVHSFSLLQSSHYFRPYTAHTQMRAYLHFSRLFISARALFILEGDHHRHYDLGNKISSCLKV